MSNVHELSIYEPLLSFRQAQSSVISELASALTSDKGSETTMVAAAHKTRSFGVVFPQILLWIDISGGIRNGGQGSSDYSWEPIF